MGTYQPLLGFRDFYPNEQRVLNYIFDTVRRAALSFGFEEYGAPVLESMELITAKSGNEIADQLFHFVDKGGRQVALRPEMTPSIARMVGSKANALKKPIKWFNIGEHFRYERPQKGRLRSFYQVNLDIFGEASYPADAEIILLTIMIMQSFGIDDFFVRISDRQLWVEFLLSIGVPDNSITDVLCVIDKIERGKEENLVDELRKICPQKLDLFGEIVRLKSMHSIGELRQFFREHCSPENSVILSRIAALSNLMDILDCVGVGDYVAIDFGIVRGLAYYTGFVFEVFDRAFSSRALAGGGRYDSLAEKLGYGSIPAVGLAIGDVTLCELLQKKGLLPICRKNLDCFMVFDCSHREYCMNLANILRKSGYSVEYTLGDVSFAKQFKSAVQSCAKFALIRGDREYEDGVVKMKNLTSEEENIVGEGEVLAFLKTHITNG